MPLVSHQYLDSVHAAGRTRKRPRARSRAGGGQTLPRWMVQRIRQLDTKDRILVELHFNGATMRSAGRAVGRSPGCVSRRIATLLRRLNHPIVDRLQDEHCPLPIEHRVVGVEHFMLGHTLRSIAEHHQLDTRQVRAILDCIRAWHQASTWSARMRRLDEDLALSGRSAGKRPGPVDGQPGSTHPFAPGDSLAGDATGRRASA